MGANVNGTIVDPAQQAGRSNNDPEEQSLFQIPNNVSLSKEQIDVLNGVIAPWKAANTKKRQEETQRLRDMESEVSRLKSEAILNSEKARTLDTLYQNPAFTQLMIDNRDILMNPGAANSPNYGNQHGQQSNVPYDDYQDGDFFKQWGNELVNKIGLAMQQVLTPVVSQLSVSARDSEFQTLKLTAQDRNLPDPTQYMDAIDHYQRSLGLPLVDAYYLAVGKGLSVKPPVRQNDSVNTGVQQNNIQRPDQTGLMATQQPGQINQQSGLANQRLNQAGDGSNPSVLMSPGGTEIKGTSVVSTGSGDTSKLDRAISVSDERRTGKGYTIPAIGNIVGDIVASMRNRGDKVDI